MGRPLPRDQKAHLASALEGLPPEIAYLREMILAIADGRVLRGPAASR